MANSLDPDQTAPIGAVSSESTLFASILNLSVMLGNDLQQTTSADNIFRCVFFLGTLRVKLEDLRVLRRSPDLLNNVKIGQGQLQLIMEQILFLPYTFWSSDLNNLMNPGHRSA